MLEFLSISQLSTTYIHTYIFNNLNTFQNNGLKKKNIRGAVLLLQLLKGEKVATILLRKTGGKSLQVTGQVQCNLYNSITFCM